MCRRLLARVLQVADEEPQTLGALGSIRVRRQHARHHVQPAALQCLRKPQRRRHARGEIVFAPGQRRQTAVALLPVAGRHVEQHHVELLRLHARRDLLGLVVYGNANSTARNPACAASVKRSRNGTSVNRNERLAENRGIVGSPPPMLRGDAKGRSDAQDRAVEFGDDPSCHDPVPISNFPCFTAAATAGCVRYRTRRRARRIARRARAALAARAHRVRRRRAPGQGRGVSRRRRAAAARQHGRGLGAPRRRAATRPARSAWWCWATSCMARRDACRARRGIPRLARRGTRRSTSCWCAATTTSRRRPAGRLGRHGRRRAASAGAVPRVPRPGRAALGVRAVRPRPSGRHAARVGGPVGAPALLRARPPPRDPAGIRRLHRARPRVAARRRPLRGDRRDPALRACRTASPAARRGGRLSQICNVGVAVRRPQMCVDKAVDNRWIAPGYAAANARRRLFWRSFSPPLSCAQKILAAVPLDPLCFVLSRHLNTRYSRF